MNLSKRCTDTSSWFAGWWNCGCLSLVLAAVLFLVGCANHAPQPQVQPQAQVQAVPEPKVSEPEIDPGTQAAFEKAVGLLRQQQYDQAVAVLTPITIAHPELPGPLVNLAVAYIHLDRQEQAVTTLRQALESDAKHSAALNWLAILERRAGRFEQARSLYQQLLDDHPESSYGHLNLGILCDLYLQQADCALRHYRRYQQLSAEGDDEVGRWIVEVERRQQRGKQ